MIRKTKSLFVTILLFIFFNNMNIYSQEQKFSTPNDPVVKMKDIEIEKFSYPVELYYANGDKTSGVFRTVTDKFPIITGSSSFVNTKVSVDEILFVEFIKWKGEKKSKDTYSFYPSRIRICYKNNTVIETDGTAPFFYTIDYEETNGKKMKLYSYYYDYRKKNIWENSQQKEMNYPETHPNPNTIIKIVFLKK